jgi:hypothetical protein
VLSLFTPRARVFREGLQKGREKGLQTRGQTRAALEGCHTCRDQSVRGLPACSQVHDLLQSVPPSSEAAGMSRGRLLPARSGDAVGRPA